MSQELYYLRYCYQSGRNECRWCILLLYYVIHKDVMLKISSHSEII
ncbi:unnamed protein product, partial [Brassica rapa subsp. trilocularis]